MLLPLYFMHLCKKHWYCAGRIAENDLLNKNLHGFSSPEGKQDSGVLKSEKLKNISRFRHLHFFI